MRGQVWLVAVLLTASPAYAAWFDDAITHSLGANIGQAIDKANRDVGRAVEKAAQDAANQKGAQATKVDAKALLHDLSIKSDDDLLSLSVSADPCSEIDCHGVAPEIARQSIGLVRTNKQSIIDLEVRKSQAWAAVTSASISFLSLAISIASFVRAGRRAV